GKRAAQLSLLIMNQDSKRQCKFKENKLLRTKMKDKFDENWANQSSCS
ncbi:25085_t:CDS:1, partial [Cetraspora pellucida]